MPLLTLTDRRERPRSDEAPFRILILGDFSGKERRETMMPDSVQIRKVDRDNLESLMERLSPEVWLEGDGDANEATVIRFSELDDFHPDALFDRLPVFQELRKLLKALKNPETSADAVREVATRFSVSSSAVPEPAPSESPPAPSDDEGDLLDQVLSKSSGDPGAHRQSRPVSDWDAFLSDIVRPHLASQAAPGTDEMRRILETAIGDAMGRILQHPRFQALESVWRGLYWLVRRLETDEALSVHLLDLPKSEAFKDLVESEDMRKSEIYRLLVASPADTISDTSGDESWALMAGAYSFGTDSEDMALLDALARVGKAAGMPFIGAADPSLLGCRRIADLPDPDKWVRNVSPDDAPSAWDALRQAPHATYAGLVMPRFLIRLPYGEKTDPIDRFDFEEMPGEPAHAHYLWGPPAFFAAHLLGSAFSRDGWNMAPGRMTEADGFPVHVYQKDGAAAMTSPAEVILTHRSAEAMMAAGIMPLIAFRQEDRLRLARFQSIADPPARLSGPWHAD